jgi:LysR family glycine cleavage system transcriptional activator
MEYMVDSVDGLANSNELKVYAPSCIGTKWLMPRIKEFRRRHSKIQLCLNIGAAPPEVAQKDKNITISIGEGKRSKNTRQDYLQQDSIFPVCSPTLLPQGAPLRDVGDLKMFELLDVAGPVADGVDSEWMSWLSICGDGTVIRKPTLRFGNSLGTIQAAIAGSGIALARGWVAGPDLLSGALVKPIDIEVRSQDPYYLIYPRAFENHDAIISFREWLFETIAADDIARKTATLEATEETMTEDT